MVKLLGGRRAEVPAETVINTEFACRLPGVSSEERPVRAARILRGLGKERCVGVVHRTEQETGNRVATVDIEHAGFSLSEAEYSRRVIGTGKIVLQLPDLPSKLERVATVDPGHQVVEHARWARFVVL